MCVACSANEGIEKKVILIRVFGFSFEEMGATFFIKKTEYIFIKEKEKYWKKEIFFGKIEFFFRKNPASSWMGQEVKEAVAKAGKEGKSSSSLGAVTMCAKNFFCQTSLKLMTFKIKRGRLLPQGFPEAKSLAKIQKN